MRLLLLFLFALVLMPFLASAAEKPASTQAAIVASKPVTNEGVAITVSLKQRTISTDEQPYFIVRFTNLATDYVNFYDVKAYCDWDIEFKPIGKPGDQPRSLHLKMDKLSHRIPIAHLQAKATESLEIPIDLNDPPFTFHYENAPVAGHIADRSIRHLTPGKYQVALTISLNNPFGKGYHQWSGPVTTEPIELTVRALNPNEKVEPTAEQLAAYTAAIHRWTDKFDGLWLNGRFPEIDLPRDAKAEDVIEAAVNRTILDSKVYRILKTEPFVKKGSPEINPGTAALVQVGKAYKVVVIFPFEKSGWWSRFYDAELAAPTLPAANTK